MKAIIRSLAILAIILAVQSSKSVAIFKVYLTEHDEVGFSPSTFLQVKESITEVRPHADSDFIQFKPFVQMKDLLENSRKLEMDLDRTSKFSQSFTGILPQLRMENLNRSAAKFRDLLGILRLHPTDDYYIVDIFSIELKNGKHFTSEKSFKIADSDLIIRSFVILDDFIYYAGVSISKATIIFCKKAYSESEKDILPVCYTVESQVRVSTEEYSTVDVQVSAFRNKANRSIVIIYIKNSREEYFQNTFWLFIKEEFRSLRIPVDEFIIGKVQIVNYNFDRDIINALVLNSKSGYSDLVELRLSHGYLDVGALRQSLIKSHVQNFDSNSHTIIIYEYDTSQFQVRINILHVENIESHTLHIPKQKRIIKTEFAGTFVLIQTMNLDYVNELYILDTNTKTLYKNNRLIIRMTDIWYLIADKQSHFIYLFSGDNNIKIFELNDLMFDTFRVIEKDSSNKGYITYSREDQKLLRFQVTAINFNTTSIASTTDITFNPRYETVHKEEVYGNDVKIKSPHVLYFNEVKIDYDPLEFKDCKITRFMNNYVYSIYVCDNKSIILVNESFWNGLSMTEVRKHYRFYFRFFDTNEIKDYRYFFDEYLVILLKNGQMRILKLSVIDQKIPYDRKYIVSNDLVEKCDKVIFANQGIRCEERDRYVYYIMNIDNERFYLDKIAEIKKEIVYKNTTFNSYYRANNYYCLNKNEKTSQISLISFQSGRVETRHTNFPFKDKITDDISVHWIGFTTILFILNKKTNMELYVLFRYSYLKMPFGEFIDDYKEFIKISPSHVDGYFFIIYRSTANKIKGISYKAVFDSRKRLIKSFVLDENDCKKVVFSFRPQNSKDFALYYSCADLESISKLKVFEFIPNGPFIILDNTKRFLEVDYQGIKTLYKLNPIVLSKNPELKFTDFLVKERSDKGGYVELELEKEKIIQLKGGVRSITVVPKIEGVEFIDRIHLIKEEELISNINSLKPSMQADIQIVEENPFFNFGSYIYSQKRLEQNNNFFDCQKIMVTHAEYDLEKELQLLYFCRNRRTYLYYITDLSHITIKLDAKFAEPNQSYDRPYIINVKNFIYFFMTHKGSTVLRGIKIDYSGSNSSVVLSHGFNLAPFNYRRSFLGTYFVYYQEISNSIILFLHNVGTASIEVKKMSLQEFSFDISSENHISIFESVKIRFDTITFFQRSNIIWFLGVNNFYIYEIKLYQENSWKYKIESKYINYLTDSEHEVIMDKNADYLAVMNFRSEQRPNIYIFQKDRFASTNNLFYVIDRHDFTTKNYHILNFALQKNSTTKVTSILIIYLEQMQRDGITYKYLRSKQFMISEFKLRLRPHMLSYNQKITFEIEHIEAQESGAVVEHHTIQLILNENLGLFALKILVTVAACAFVALNITVCFVFSSNQKLQEEIDHIKQLQQHEDVAPILNNQEQR
jgi:hypothetical protein